MKTFDAFLTRRDFLKEAGRATAAVGAFPSISLVAPTLAARAGEVAALRKSRISYFCNGQIHVNEVGQPEGKPLTPGQPYWDFKPSWSKTGDMLVFFRRLRADPNVAKWITATCVINVDGSGFQQLTDGTYTDFNPTWTRDGLNTPIWNRKSDNGRDFKVMQSKVGGKPGEEVPITDEGFFNWAHSCLMDGRILVSAAHPKLGLGIYLLTRREGPKPVYEPVQCELTSKGLYHRMSISPSEKQICFEHSNEFKASEYGHTLYIGDFDAEKRSITNLKVFANAAKKQSWFAYPRWIDGESAVIYHSNDADPKHNQLYVYRLANGTTQRVSTNAASNYLYPHGEAAPC